MSDKNIHRDEFAIIADSDVKMILYSYLVSYGNVSLLLMFVNLFAYAIILFFFTAIILARFKLNTFSGI